MAEAGREAAGRYDDHRADLRQFADRAGELLGRYGATAIQAAQLAEVDLAGQVDREHFTVAIVGRMKSGKSTLLNALLGRRLAPAGVNETTASVNRFDHGIGACEQVFEVHWKDPRRAPETRSLDRVIELTGRSSEAQLVDHLRFHNCCPFLRGVRVIDAPGTMSMLDSHEKTATDLITRRHGERADATILVLPTVATQADEAALKAFGADSRFPGQGPYNTIAVLQKWESIADPAPEEAARRLAAGFREALRREVSDVIPVSGLLAMFAATTAEPALDRLAFLATRCDAADLAALLKTEDRFGRDRDGVPLSAIERLDLFEEIRASLLGSDADHAAGTFEMVRMAVSYAARHGILTGEPLRKALHKVSNLDLLRETLDRRFFNVAGLVQSGSLLKRALEPCTGALFALRDDLGRRRALVDEAERIANLTGGIATSEIERRLGAYLQRSLPLIRVDLAPLEATIHALARAAQAAERDFRMLTEDIAQIIRLGEGDAPLPQEQERQARHLFGQYGLDRESRLGLPAGSTDREQHEAARNLHQQFFALRMTSRIAEHAEARLSLILDDLDREGAS